MRRATVVLALTALIAGWAIVADSNAVARVRASHAIVRAAAAFDTSAPIATAPAAADTFVQTTGAQAAPTPPSPPVITVPDGAAAVEQTTMGTRPAAALAESFDGLGVGFEGPQGAAAVRNPSDNSLAVGPDHIVQTVNSRMAVGGRDGARCADGGGCRQAQHEADDHPGRAHVDPRLREVGQEVRARATGDPVQAADRDGSQARH
jgi:hypothetical protein